MEDRRAALPHRCMEQGASEAHEGHAPGDLLLSALCAGSLTGRSQQPRVGQPSYEIAFVRHRCSSLRSLKKDVPPFVSFVPFLCSSLLSQIFKSSSIEKNVHQFWNICGKKWKKFIDSEKNHWIWKKFIEIDKIHQFFHINFEKAHRIWKKTIEFEKSSSNLKKAHRIWKKVHGIWKTIWEVFSHIYFGCTACCRRPNRCS